MNIFINTLGTRGDVQPYVALGKGLKAAGHEVTVCTSASFEAFITDNGLRYGYMTDDFMKLIDSDAGREAMENTTNLWESIKTYRSLMKEAGPLQRQMLSDSWAAAQQANPDLIIFHPKAYGGPHFAEKMGIPVIFAIPLPIYVPTAEFSNMSMPKLPLGGWYNKFSYTLLLKATDMGVGRYVKAWRAEHGLPAMGRGRNMLHTHTGEAIPVLHGYSQHVLPRPQDWPESAHVTGYWFLDHESDWQPSPELAAFLDAGEAPVYVGFGSMAGRNPQRVTQIVVDALLQAGIRGIIGTGWGGLSPDDLPETIFKVDNVPHDWLFPRMAAVVHHGGAGTTAAGLRAGRPTVICPFIVDQPFWGARVRALGVGSEPIPQKQLSAEKLAAAIREVSSSATMRQKAAALGEKIRQEDGIATAVEIIERVASGQPKPVAMAG